MDESNHDLKGTAVQKSYSDCSDKKRTPEFVGDIKAIIANDPCEESRFTARDMGVSKLLIRLVLHEDI